MSIVEIVSCEMSILTMGDGGLVRSDVIELDRAYRLDLRIRAEEEVELKKIRVMLHGPGAVLEAVPTQPPRHWIWGPVIVGPSSPFVVDIPLWIPTNQSPTFRSKYVNISWDIRVSTELGYEHLFSEPPQWYLRLKVVPKKILYHERLGYLPWGPWRDRSPLTKDWE